jgi:hypothetical protein
MEDAIWQIESELKKKIDLDLANFILDAGEKSLKHTIDIADKTTNRAFTVVLILIPVISTVIGLLINSLKGTEKFRSLDCIFLSILIILMAITLGFLFKLVFPRLFMVLGREPKDIITPGMLMNDLEDKKKLLAFKLNEIKNCQNRISYNRIQNAKRIRELSRILKFAGLLALLAIAIYLIILYRMVVQ